LHLRGTLTYYTPPQLILLLVFITTLFETSGIVDLHENGKIWAESEGEGKGCTFFVQLPLHSRNHVESTVDKRGSLLRGGSVLELSPSVKQNLLSDVIDGKEPLAIVPNRGSPITAKGQVPVSSVVESWKPTILVVDDSAMNRKVDKFTFPSVTPSSLVPSIVLAFSNPTSMFSSCTHLCLPFARCWYAC